MRNDQLGRISLWSEAIAIGNDDSRENIRRQLKEKNTRGKMVTGDDGITMLKEPHSAYTTLFDDKKMVLSHENSYFLDVT